MRTQKQITILGIGNELLSGSVTNTNATYLSSQLARLGILVDRHVVVPDELDVIVSAIQECRARQSSVITTGGLGPTADDLSLEAVARYLDVPLEPSPRTEAHILKRIANYNQRASRAAAKMAQIPRGALILLNSLGTAPGVICSQDEFFVASLPGPPVELQPMFEQKVLPFLAKWAGRSPCFLRTRLRTAGLAEPQVIRKLGRYAAGVPGKLGVGIYTSYNGLDIVLEALTQSKSKRPPALMREYAQEIHRRLGPAVYAEADGTLEAIIGQLLRKKGLSLSLAESCTGGLISKMITDAPGASDYYRGSILAYSNGIKSSHLKISEALLRKHGAVSGPVARAMAKGVRESINTEIGVSITGIAGPTGGSAQKPVGTAFVGIADSRGSRVHQIRGYGTRSTVRKGLASKTLNLLRLHLLER
ncbi:MAG: CinA family nicotinamide mononucleotide deamidase-related protein [Candidatus Omnitrophica bacterium]|nr:CinA family nicotinamide mononucleotide deamidase-related protein [Candidatus Omnitrophota bacterium]